MSSIKESALRLVLKARDTLSRSVKQSAYSLEALRKEAQSLKKKLSALEKQDRLLSSFQKQLVTVRDAGKAYREAQAKVKRLAREYQQADKPTKALLNSLNASKKSVMAASNAYQQQRKKLAGMRIGMDQAGLSNRNLTVQQQRLQTELKQTSAAFKKVDGKAKKANRTLRSNALKNTAKNADKASSSVNRLEALKNAGLKSL
ncbi:hypothetical protein ACH42_01025 [Endozoicomonas sp. (ex Bugula neritina AB1)]|nr:hypothetical protein ACH42_01025 [Endozoicomonas sp. (ex Bugula neritina AB1)]